MTALGMQWPGPKSRKFKDDSRIPTPAIPVMDTSRLLNLRSLHPCFHYKDRSDLPLLCKAPHTPNANFYCPEMLSVSFISQNCSTLTQYVGNPSRKSVIRDGCLGNNPETNVSSICKMITESTDCGLFEGVVVAYIDMLEYAFPVEEFRCFSRLIKAFGGLSDVNKSR